MKGSRGVTMQSEGLMSDSERIDGAARALVAVVLFGLVFAIWVWLWVPMAPIF